MGAQVLREAEARAAAVDAEWAVLAPRLAGDPARYPPAEYSRARFGAALAAAIAHAAFLPAAGCFALVPVLSAARRTGDEAGAALDYDPAREAVTLTAARPYRRAPQTWLPASCGRFRRLARGGHDSGRMPAVLCWCRGCWPCGARRMRRVRSWRVAFVRGLVAPADAQPAAAPHPRIQSFSCWEGCEWTVLPVKLHLTCASVWKCRASGAPTRRLVHWPQARRGGGHPGRPAERGAAARNRHAGGRQPG